MVLDGDRLLHVVLTDVLVHLLYSERLPVLGDKATKLVSFLFALLNANKKQQTAAVSATMFTLGVFRLLQSHTTAYHLYITVSPPRRIKFILHHIRRARVEGSGSIYRM